MRNTPTSDYALWSDSKIDMDGTSLIQALCINLEHSWFNWHVMDQKTLKQNLSMFYLFTYMYKYSKYLNSNTYKVIIEKSRGGRFYGTGIEIWAGFGPIGSIEKKRSGPIMSNFWRCFFHVFRGKKKLKFFKNIVVSALRSCIKLKLKNDIFFS